MTNSLPDVNHGELSRNSVQVVNDEGKGGSMNIVMIILDVKYIRNCKFFRTKLKY